MQRGRRVADIDALVAQHPMAAVRVFGACALRERRTTSRTGRTLSLNSDHGPAHASAPPLPRVSGYEDSMAHRPQHVDRPRLHRPGPLPAAVPVLGTLPRPGQYQALPGEDPVDFLFNETATTE